jgi:hypothetical protein
VHEPEHKPEFTIVPEPELLPDFVVEPSAKPEPVEPPKPELEPVALAASEPLPDFIVPPRATPEPPPPPPLPEPEPEPDLGPLPDYIVDPNRPPEAKPRTPERTTPPATPKPFLEVASEPEPEGSSTGLYFPPATSFPIPRDDPDEDAERKRDAPKAPRRRPASDPGKSKRGKSGAEPGDEAEEVSWMEGLSNRLSAYSLAEDEASPASEPGDDKPEDAETGT